MTVFWTRHLVVRHLYFPKMAGAIPYANYSLFKLLTGFIRAALTA